MMECTGDLCQHIVEAAVHLIGGTSQLFRGLLGSQQNLICSGLTKGAGPIY